MYNLLYYQLIVKLCTSLTDAECDQILAKHSTDEIVEFCGFNNLGSAMAFILKTMNKCRHLRPKSSFDEATSSSTSTNSQPQINLNLLEQKLQKLSLPFLRVAALLRHHIYEQNLPEISVPQLEFVCLIYYLELVTVDINWDSFDAAKALYFIPGMERELPESWCRQLMSVRQDGDMKSEQDCISTLIADQHGLWQQPRLLRLPREYEKLFTVQFLQFFFQFVENNNLTFVSSIIMKDHVQIATIFHVNAQFVYFVEQSFV